MNPDQKRPSIKERLKEYYVLTKTAFEEWSFDQAFQHAAALGFYTLFSMAPILIIAVAVAGFVLGPEAARGELRDQLEDMIGRESAEVVESAIAASDPERVGLFRTLIGFVILIVGATTVFHQLQRSLNQIWRVVAKPSRSGILTFIKVRVLSLALVLTIGFLLLVSLVFSTALAAVINYAEHRVAVPRALLTSADVLISLIVFTVLFGLIFKVLPDVHLRWRDVWKGAFLTAILFTIGRYVISLYLTIAGPASTYGAAGSLVAVIFWVYYSGLILLFGAEFTKVYVRSRGFPLIPKKTAARIRHEIIED
jgi:membrane protein